MNPQFWLLYLDLVFSCVFFKSVLSLCSDSLRRCLSSASISINILNSVLQSHCLKWLPLPPVACVSSCSGCLLVHLITLIWLCGHYLKNHLRNNLRPKMLSSSREHLHWLLLGTSHHQQSEIGDILNSLDDTAEFHFRQAPVYSQSTCIPAYGLSRFQHYPWLAQQDSHPWQILDSNFCSPILWVCQHTAQPFKIANIRDKSSASKVFTSLEFYYLPNLNPVILYYLVNSLMLFRTDWFQLGSPVCHYQKRKARVIF